MEILDFSTTHTQETDEIINVSNSNPINLSHDIFYNKTGKLVTIYTAASGGGTQLTEGTDFDVGGTFPDGSLPTSISPDVAYTTIEITNDEYHDTDLYVNYYPIGDVISAARWNTSTLPGQVDEVSSNTTITERAALRIVHVTTGATDRTVTLPAGSDMEAGDEIEVYKVDDGSGKATISRAGSDTIDGVTSVDIDSQYDMARVRWTGSFWTLVEYKDHGSNADGSWRREADGTMVQWGSSADADINMTTSSLGWYRSDELQIDFPLAFAAVPSRGDILVCGLDDSSPLVKVPETAGNITTTEFPIYAYRGDSAIEDVRATWQATGRWRA